jgi:peptidoglycan/LPS O-acetylase OafA/YrhL
MNHVNMRLFIAGLPYAAGLPDALVSSLVWNGQYGVQMFFAVSGFLITSMSLRRWGPLLQINLRDFYALRFARIAPLLLALLAVLSALHAAGLRHFVVAPAAGGLGRALFAALAFHVNVLEAQRGYLPANWDVLWSLSVEEAFYLFFPLICRTLGRGRFLIAFLVTFVALGPFARTALSHGNEVWAEYSYLGGMDSIALGCLTALVMSRIRPDRRLLWIPGGIGIALLIFVLCGSVQTKAWGIVHAGLDMTLLAVGTCLVIALVAHSRWRSPWLLSPLVAFGRHSYEVYLTHMFVVFALFDLFVTAGEPLRWTPILFVGVILIAGLLGSLVARYFTEPMNRLLRRYLARPNPGTLSAASDAGRPGAAGTD